MPDISELKRTSEDKSYCDCRTCRCHTCRIYRQEVCVALHEASHLAAAIHAGVPVNYAEIIDVPHVPLKQTAGNVFHFPDHSSDKTITDDVFVAMAAIAMTKIYHLSPFGVGGDWKNVRERLALLEKTDKVEKKIAWKARQFVVRHKNQIFQLAHALQVRRRLDAEEAKRIYRRKEEVIVPRKFLDAVGVMWKVKWAEPNWEEFREFEQYYPGGKSGIEFPAEYSKN
jgi:hypothetical protein